MPQVINTNISALNAQRNLNTSQLAGHRAMERLSSGLRINSAKDDAAGLAIATRMTSQIKGLTQAARNANDGVSLTATADGTLKEIGNSLQRIRELAVQSANATNSASDRASLQAEATQLTAEITRQASSAQFNGINLLDGTFTAQTFQVGANSGVNNQITIASIADSRAAALGSQTIIADGTVTGGQLAATDNATNFNAVLVSGAALTVSTTAGQSPVIAYAAKASAATIATAVNTAAAGLGVTATATNSATLSGLTSLVGGGATTFNLWGGDTAVAGNTAAINCTITNVNDLTSLVAAINGQQGTTGITAAFSSSTSKSSILLSTSDGRNIGINDFLVGTVANNTINFAGQNGGVGTTLGTSAILDSSVATGTVTLTSSKGTMTVANATTDVFAGAGAIQSVFASVSGVDLSTTLGAQTAITTVDAALSQVNASQGALGAVSNRFDSVISNLQSTSENMSASRSRIQDADFAAESAELSRSQVLQQAGTAMLAQANQSTQGVMALLR